jgi:hypothetical protein
LSCEESGGGEIEMEKTKHFADFRRLSKDRINTNTCSMISQDAESSEY